MSVVDAVQGRISEIQARIQALSSAGLSSAGVSSAVSSSASDGASSASSAFADALASITGGASATPTSVDAGQGTLATGSGATGSDVAADAKKYLGVPYVFGGTTTAGMDCSGLVQTVFKDLGVTMPRVVPDQAKMGVAVPSLADAQPGDLIIPKGEGHVVIYMGDGKVLHAPHPGKDVRIVDNWYKDSDIATIRRIVPANAAASGASASALSASSLSSLAALTGGSSSSSLLSSLSALTGSGTTATSATDMQTAALMSLMNGGSLT